MAVFAILSEATSPQLGQKIAATYPNDHYVLSECQWLVSDDKITKDVTAGLDIDNGAYGRVVAFKVDGYFGYYNKSLWEWLKLKEAK